MNAELAEAFGLTHAQMRDVQNAVPGNEANGYAQALFGVDGEWRGIEVFLLQILRGVIAMDRSRATG